MTIVLRAASRGSVCRWLPPASNNRDLLLKRLAAYSVKNNRRGDSLPETHAIGYLPSSEALLRPAPTPLFVATKRSGTRLAAGFLCGFREAGVLRSDGSGSAALRILRGASCSTSPRWARNCGSPPPAASRGRGRLRAYAPGLQRNSSAGSSEPSLCWTGRRTPPGLRAGSGCAASAAAGARNRRPVMGAPVSSARGMEEAGCVPSGGLSARGRHADAAWYVARRSVHGRGLFTPPSSRSWWPPLCGCRGKRPHGKDFRPWRRLRRQLPAGLPGAGSFRLRRGLRAQTCALPEALQRVQLSMSPGRFLALRAAACWSAACWRSSRGRPQCWTSARRSACGWRKARRVSRGRRAVPPDARPSAAADHAGAGRALRQTGPAAAARWATRSSSGCSARMDAASPVLRALPGVPGARGRHDRTDRMSVPLMGHTKMRIKKNRPVT